MSRFILPALIVLLVVLAAGAGYVIGRDDDETAPAECPLVETPVSGGGFEDVCAPAVELLVEALPVQMDSISTSEGFSTVGTVWLSDDGTRLCVDYETPETRESPDTPGSFQEVRCTG